MNAREKLIRTAKRKGVPRDQILNFMSAGYCPFPRQLELHAACRMADSAGGPDQIGYGGARGPGKSHAVFAQIALDDCQRIEGLKVLFLRKVGKQAAEQFEDLRRTVLAYTPHEYKAHKGVLIFPNGSRIFLGHFKNESDVDRYLGIEYHVIVIEEATTLTLPKYRALRDSNRSSRSDVRPRLYATTNPGGVGHGWFKRAYIDPWRDHGEAHTRFIPGTIDDNPMIDPGYRRKLEENTGWRLRAYRFGDWDIAAGQFFTPFRRDLHVEKSFEIPENWPVWLALDYGFTHPTVVYLLAKHDGVIYIVDEHRASKLLPPQHSAAISAMLERNKIAPYRVTRFFAGVDVFAKRGDYSGLSIADQYSAEGWKLEPANVDRINGAAEILTRLGDLDRGLPVRLKIFDRCHYLIECLPILEHDPNRPEDVLKIDVDEDGNGGDDPYDAVRYGIMGDLSPSIASGGARLYG